MFMERTMGRAVLGVLAWGRLLHTQVLSTGWAPGGSTLPGSQPCKAAGGCWCGNIRSTHLAGRQGRMGALAATEVLLDGLLV